MDENDPVPSEEQASSKPDVEGNDRVPTDAEVAIAQGELTPEDEPEGEDD